MKKIYGILIFAMLAFVLVACGPGEENEIPPVTDDVTVTFSGINAVEIIEGDGFDPKAGVTATDSVTGDITSSIVITGEYLTNTAGTYTITYTVNSSAGKEFKKTRVLTVKAGGGHTTPPVEVVIMHGAPYEVDPFDPLYSGTEQVAKQNKQREVEARLNVTVKYKAYPANAPWGPDRATAIIQATISGKPLADIYWTTSDWTQNLVKGNAIVAVDKYLNTHGKNITEPTKEIGSYNHKVYGFGTGSPSVDDALYYNADLVDSLGIQNPTQMYLDGEWNWSNFENWADGAKAALTSLGDDYSVLGGVPGVWAENLVPLNGGSLINLRSGKVGFHQTPALQTYDFLSDLYDKQLFEGSPAYDAGSPAWMNGKVLIHPGSFWFVAADNRWKNLNFELGFVPYPRSNTYTGEYVSAVSGVSVYNVAAGLSPEKEELAFRVWNEIQLWKTPEEGNAEFENILIERFAKDIYIDAYLDIADKATLDIINALGISTYGPSGWMGKINTGIRTRTSRTAMDEIKPIYENALEEYLSGV